MSEVVTKNELLRRQKISESLKEQHANGVRTVLSKMWKYWQGKKRSVKDREKMRLAKLGRFGEEANNWRGGVEPTRVRIRKLDQYKKWREEVFERDDYTCQECGQRGGDLHADHHPKMFAEILDSNKVTTLFEAVNCEKLWDIENGRTLCVPCHRETFTGVPKKPWQNS